MISTRRLPRTAGVRHRASIRALVASPLQGRSPSRAGSPYRTHRCNDRRDVEGTDATSPRGHRSGETDQLRHMPDDAVPRALSGGGWGSRRPTLLQMWLIQWAPGNSLAGWALAVAVLPRLGRDGNALTFIFLGMFAGSALWAAVAVCSLPCSFSSDRCLIRLRERPRDCGRRLLRLLARLHSW